MRIPKGAVDGEGPNSHRFNAALLQSCFLHQQCNSLNCQIELGCESSSGPLPSGAVNANVNRSLSTSAAFKNLSPRPSSLFPPRSSHDFHPSLEAIPTVTAGAMPGDKMSPDVWRVTKFEWEVLK